MNRHVSHLWDGWGIHRRCLRWGCMGWRHGVGERHGVQDSRLWLPQVVAFCCCAAWCCALKAAASLFSCFTTSAKAWKKIQDELRGALMFVIYAMEHYRCVRPSARLRDGASSAILCVAS